VASRCAEVLISCPSPSPGRGVDHGGAAFHRAASALQGPGPRSEREVLPTCSRVGGDRARAAGPCCVAPRARRALFRSMRQRVEPRKRRACDSHSAHDPHRRPARHPSIAPGRASRRRCPSPPPARTIHGRNFPGKLARRAGRRRRRDARQASRRRWRPRCGPGQLHDPGRAPVKQNECEVAVAR